MASNLENQAQFHGSCSYTVFIVQGSCFFVNLKKERERNEISGFFFCDSEKCLKSLKTQEFHNITHLLASDSLKVNH